MAFVTFEASQLSVKVTQFSSWFLCSFLFRLFPAHERKERAANVSPVRTLSFTLFEWLFAWSLLRGGYQMPSLSPHRARCSECFRPLLIRNFAGFSAVHSLCYWQRLQTHPQRCTASVLCKFVSSS